MNSSPQPIRIILADDHALVRAGMRALVEKLPNVVVLAEASDGREVLELVQAQTPDVVVMDIAMPGLNGLEAAERLRQEFPKVRVVILSMHQNEEYVCRALKAGVVGYLLKKSATTELESALQCVLRREIYLSREIARQLPKSFVQADFATLRPSFEKLTNRQREILQLIAEGQNTKQIAAWLKISPKTVEYHRMRLMTVLGRHDIPGLVRYALSRGLIDSES